MNRLLLMACRPLVPLALVGAVGVASLVAPADGGAATVSHRNQAVNHAALGVYAGPANVPRVTGFQTQVGSGVHYVMDFLDGSSWADIAHPSSSSLSTWSSLGYQPIWGVPILPSSGGTLAAGATGAYDLYFASLAQALVAAGQGDAILRLGWEFNGFWFPWGAIGRPSPFIHYWRHIVTAMQAIPGAHFSFEWNPSRGDQFGAGDLGAYYPGNAYVSYVGLDIFDVEWQTYPGAAAEFANIVTQPYGLDWLAQFSAQHHKPMVFPEWGLGWGRCSNGKPVSVSSGAVCGGDNAVYIRSMSQWCSTHNVFEVTFWDYGTSVVNATNQNPQAAAALRRYWGAGRVPATASPAASSITTVPRRASRQRVRTGAAAEVQRPSGSSTETRGREPRGAL